MQSITKKGKHEKYSVEVVLRDTSTRRDLYVFALLKFDVLKNSICIVSFLLAL